MATATALKAPRFGFSDGEIRRNGEVIGTYRTRNTRPGAMLGGFGCLPKYDVFDMTLASGAQTTFKSWTRAKAWVREHAAQGN